MPVRIVTADITEIVCDAIVAPTDEYCSHISGVDARIHEAAGERLFERCTDMDPLEIGMTYITDACGLTNCKYVIHAACPVWINGFYREKVLLEQCYIRSMERAAGFGCESVAIPLMLSNGDTKYPKHLTLDLAMRAVTKYLSEKDMTVYIVVDNKSDYELDGRLLADLEAYIGEQDSYEEYRRSIGLLDDDGDLLGGEYSGAEPQLKPEDKRKYDKAEQKFLYAKMMRDMCPAQCLASDLGFDLPEMDKSFSELLFQLIDRKKMTDVECYKRANIDRKTFSKIKCNPNYRPSKVTAVSFAIALELDMDETRELLQTAGMALSRSYKFDVIIGYFISTGNYDINQINEVLFHYDQPLLGC